MRNFTILQTTTMLYCIGLMLIIYALFTQIHAKYSLGPIKNWLYGIPVVISPTGYQLLFFGVVIFTVATFYIIFTEGNNIPFYSSFTFQIFFIILMFIAWILLSIQNNLRGVLIFESENSLLKFSILLFGNHLINILNYSQVCIQ